MLVILDRDGVINYDSEDYIKSPAEWLPIPGSLAAIAQLNAAGHYVVVATNQSGIARGYYSLKTLTAIHHEMHNQLKAINGYVDGIYFCPHHPDENCGCRKPKPGLLLQIKRDFPDAFSNAIFIGDSLKDIQAAKAARCASALVKTGNGEATLAAGIGLEGVPVYADLADFVRYH